MTTAQGVIPNKGQRGFLLIEVLITIVILAFGLLGLAGLQTRMQAIEMESYQRSQALILLDDMISRISSNRANAASYSTGSPVGTGDSQPADCAATTSFGHERDLCEWSNALKGVGEQAGGANAGAMVGGRGCIDAIAGSTPPAYRVTVAWQGLQPTVAPSLTCASGSYSGDDAYRRSIAKTISIANLLPPGP